MKIIKYSPFLFTFAALVGFSSPLRADLPDAPGEGLYFSNGKITLSEIEKFQVYLQARNGVDKSNLKIAQIKNDVFICPVDGPQIPIHLSGYELFPSDTIKTGLDSRVVVFITPTIKMTLGEKSIIKFYQKNNKLFIKIIVGNIRISATEINTDNKYYLETSDFISEISTGDFATSVSKVEGSSIFVLQGNLFTCLQKDLSLSYKIATNEIYTQLKNAELKHSTINIIHKNFIENELNFNFEGTNQGLTINAILSRMSNAPHGLLTRLSLTNLNEKDIVILHEDITNFLCQDNANSIFSRSEAQGISKYILGNGKFSSTEDTNVKSKVDTSKDDILKERQAQMQIKVQKLKEIEDKLLQEAREADLKAKSIK